MQGTLNQHSDIYEPGNNCWTVGSATYVSILIDYANYYKALYEALLKAKHSIFILGWDIDSRIELVRGEDVKNNIITLNDVLVKVARENPSLQIYLNKWNYSTFFISQREPFWVNHWKNTGLKNIHVCLDGRIPFAGCHHQKIVLVDDEIAFWGGMDVAQGRWDKRTHHVEEPCRADPVGLPNPAHVHSFGPYHDIQAVCAGPIVSSFSYLVRERWRVSCDIDTVPIRNIERRDLPLMWPQSYKPKFENVTMALARTVPEMQGKKTVKEVEQLLYDEIAQAESFIYIENQYLVVKKFALALKRRLKEKPDLRVLMVSCHEPQGIMERKVMWAGRARFADVLFEKAEYLKERVAIVYPVCKEGDKEESVHIHSKLMIIDDKYLHIGSSNIADRSMGLDTELDASIVGDDEKTCKTIEAVRNDLLREHTGREINDIQKVINGGESVFFFCKDLETSTQHFRKVNDDEFRKEKFQNFARFIGDPPKPIVPILGRIKYHSGMSEGGLPRYAFFVGLLLPVLAAIGAVVYFTPLKGFLSVEGITGFLETMQSSKLALLYATIFYVMAATLFCPITILTAAMVVVFGPLKGVAIAYMATLLSGLVGYSVGRSIGPDRTQALFGKLVRAILDRIKETGVVSVAILRSLPLAPFQVMNMIFGAAQVPLTSFVLGTIIGLAPGKLALALTGEGLVRMFESPSLTNIGYLTMGLIVWGMLIYFTQKISQRRQQSRAGQ